MIYMIAALLLVGLGLVLFGLRQPKWERMPFFVVGGFSLFVGAGAIYVGL